MTLSSRIQGCVQKNWFPDSRGSTSWYWNLLKPASFIYGVLFELRRAMTTSKKVDRTVICIGNVTLGGNGKTPLVSLLASHFQAFGLNPHILARGYGGKCRATTLVTKDHTLRDVGDEALILAKKAPTWVGSNRYRNAQAAIRAGADVLIMDDGLQDFSIRRDLSFVLMDAHTGIGNRHLLPMGPLRESWMSCISRANALFIIGDAEKVKSIVDFGRSKSKPVFFARRFLRVPERIKEERCVAFSGLGGPSHRFLTSLCDEGMRKNIYSFRSFPDHHNFSERQAEELLTLASRGGARLLTTEKDHIRLSFSPSGSARRALYEAATPIPMGLEMNNWDEFELFLAKVIS